MVSDGIHNTEKCIEIEVTSTILIYLIRFTKILSHGRYTVLFKKASLPFVRQTEI